MYIVVAFELVLQRVNRRCSCSTLMLTLGDIVLVRLASNIIRGSYNNIFCRIIIVKVHFV